MSIEIILSFKEYFLNSPLHAFYKSGSRSIDPEYYFCVLFRVLQNKCKNIIKLNIQYQTLVTNIFNQNVIFQKVLNQGYQIQTKD